LYRNTLGRLNQVLGPGLYETHGVRYERFSDSDAVEYVRYKDASNNDKIITQRQYMPDRDLLDFAENRIPGDPDTVVSRYRYGFEEGQDPAELLDTLGRRTAVIMSGSAFDDYGDHHWDFGYNDRNEVTAGNRREGTTVQQGNFMTPGDYDYTYDPIGNRTETNVDNQQNPMTYTRNNVNQYTATTYPTESFAYDDDGNLTADGTYTYVWDAENRLTEVRATSPEAGSKKLVFAYDYMNRRVCKQLFTWNTGTSDWNTTPASDKRFVYDGWNVVLWLNGLSDNAVARKYTWGLDLSGLAGDGSVSGIHGAGGIGGLLAHQSSTGTSNFWYLYDGNGNVCQILDSSYLPNVSWTTSGHFEYDAYGNIVHSRGLMGGVAQRTFCFSTKWLDTELAGAGINGAMGSTGMYYYGRRYYLPRIGRWGNHDPIGERGGLNLYGFVGNEPVCRVDLLGMYVDLRMRSINTLWDRMDLLARYDYAAVFGIRKAMWDVIQALSAIGEDDWLEGFPAWYNPDTDVIKLPATAYWGTILHEGVHVYLDFTGQYQGNRNRHANENIADLAENGIGNVDYLMAIEANWLSRSRLSSSDIAAIRGVWQVVWSAMNKLATTPSPHGYTITGQDFVNLGASLGVRYRCKTLAQKYTERIRKIECGDGCVFTCDPSNGANEIGTAAPVELPFRN